MIYVMLAEGFEEIEALSFVDILRRGDIAVSTVSVANTKTVKGSHGIEVCADIMIKDLKTVGDGIVLPGGIPGTYNLRDNPTVTELLKKHYTQGKYVAAICAAPSVLGMLGILDGKNATSYPSFETKLGKANVKNDKVVVDGKIITSRGAGTAHDFALKFVEIFKNKEISNELRSSMLYD